MILVNVKEFCLQITAEVGKIVENIQCDSMYPVKLLEVANSFFFIMCSAREENCF